MSNFVLLRMEALAPLSTLTALHTFSCTAARMMVGRDDFGWDIDFDMPRFRPSLRVQRGIAVVAALAAHLPRLRQLYVWTGVPVNASCDSHLFAANTPSLLHAGTARSNTHQPLLQVPALRSLCSNVLPMSWMQLSAVS